MPFNEEWFPRESQEALRELYRLTDGVEGRVIEVGCWEGRSTVALALACHPEVVHAVDTWDGSPGEISAELAQERDVYATFQQNIAALTSGNVRPFRIGWRDFFAEHPGPIRFMHIDAEHSYREVFDNITTALPMLADGAVICGDDAHHPPVRDAVLAHFPDAEVIATLWWVQL